VNRKGTIRATSKRSKTVYEERTTPPEGYSRAKIPTGKRTKNGIEVSVKLLDLKNRTRKRPLQYIPFHFADGFKWGYGGSHPADLVLAVLVDSLRERPPPKGWLAGEQ
jgi:hypothetical protein